MRRTIRAVGLFLAMGVLSPAVFPCAGELSAETASGGLVITSAGQAHDLSPSAAKGARVHLRGTITYYDTANSIMFLQDSTGGIFINTDRVYPVRTGDLVELEGKTDASYRAEIDFNPVIRVLGRGQSYEAPRRDYLQLTAGVGDSSLVSIVGKVQSADVGSRKSGSSVHLNILMDGGEVGVYFPISPEFDTQAMLDSTVEIKGVLGGIFDAKGQLTGVLLYAADHSAIRVLEKPEITAAQLPITSFDDIFQSQSRIDNSRRVRVRGTVTYYRKGDSLVLERDGKSIYVQTRQTDDLVIGDVVDASGFASDREYGPSLRDADLVKSGNTEAIAPRPVSYAEAFSGRYSDNLVALTGVLVSQLHDDHADTVVVNVDGHLVSGFLKDRRMAPLPVGSRIRMIGICRILSGGPWHVPYMFHLDMRSPADVRLVARPSWWTVRHLLEVLGALLLLALSTAVWALLLRKRVQKQTQLIQRSMSLAETRSRILKRISSNEAPEIVLGDLCNSVMTLLPGTDCYYLLHAMAEEAENSPEVILGGATGGGTKSDSSSSGENTPRPSASHSAQSRLFEVPLTGASKQAIGKIVVSALVREPLSSDQQEVYATITELASLAMQQSVLYERLVHHSMHDPLTDLPNRRLCEARLSSALEEAKLRGTRVAVIYIDVNRFKQINDTFGHKVGDDYLCQISSRLRSQMRPGDTLARIGGDEFLVITPFPEDGDYTSSLHARLQECFDDIFDLKGIYVTGSASFGVARYPGDGTTAEELTRNADHAMYLTKRGKTNEAPPSSASSSDIAIITPDELNAALRKDHFRLAYQPQFSSEGVLTGMEALLRLEDPILGSITPDAFITVAERSDVILKIGAWVLQNALADGVRWQRLTGKEMTIAVNVSMRELEEPDFADWVLTSLERCGFPAHRLELELVERSLVSDSDALRDQLRRLRHAGVRIALDDFGTGQSCLSVLHRLPIDTIKLDRSFILAMDDEPEVIPIIQAVATMARSLGKRIVAEGVEHVGPIPTLMKMGRIDFQGFLLGRPVASEEVDDVIETWLAGIEMPEAFRGKTTS